MRDQSLANLSVIDNVGAGLVNFYQLLMNYHSYELSIIFILATKMFAHAQSELEPGNYSFILHVNFGESEKSFFTQANLDASNKNQASFRKIL